MTKFINNKIIIISFIVFLGLYLRFNLAWGPTNHDMYNFAKDVEIFQKRQNIYLEQKEYNYTPLFFYILGALGKVQHTFPQYPFKFVERAFISLVDVSVLLVLLAIAYQRRLSLTKTAVLFFLNPVSIIISGHYGQFENITLLFLFLGIFVFENKNLIPPKIKPFLTWFLLSLGLVIKHIIVFQVLTFFLQTTRVKWKALLLFLLALIVLLLSFLPSILDIDAREKVIENVFHYKALQGLYGFSYIIKNICLDSCFLFGYTYWTIDMYIFTGIFLLFVFLIKHKDLVRACLLTTLFFLSFTSGVASQYFILPIALGSLFPTKWFYLYALVCTFFLYGSPDGLKNPVFSIVSWNIVWFFALLWFIAELSLPITSLRKAFTWLTYSKELQ